MIKYDEDEAQRLIHEAREDDERMTNAPWTACSCGMCGLVLALDCVVAANGCDGELGRQEDSDGIARTRNNLRAMADQLESAGDTINVLRSALVDAIYWLKPGLAEKRPEEMAKDREMLSKLLDGWDLEALETLSNRLEAKAVSTEDDLWAASNSVLGRAPISEQESHAPIPVLWFDSKGCGPDEFRCSSIR